jgi:C1A family cysteine protease
MSTDESEQILVSCSGAGNCEQGGYIDRASDYIESTGLPPESDFPYTATDNNCSNAEPGWQNATHKIGSWIYVTGTSAGSTVDVLKQSLYTYGPLVTTMYVYDDFQYYTGGVYSYSWGNLEGGHAIELIGYDDNNQCFIVKNSWGLGWGESGFFRIAYSQVNNQVAFGVAGGTIAYSGNFWQYATATGGGWYYLNWFGYFNQNATSAWLYHQTLGWLYPYVSSALSADSVWFWDAQWDGKGGFWWTNAKTYPWLYSNSEATWLWFDAAASTPSYRLFWNSNTQKWETH